MQGSGCLWRHDLRFDWLQRRGPDCAIDDEQRDVNAKSRADAWRGLLQCDGTASSNEPSAGKSLTEAGAAEAPSDAAVGLRERAKQQVFLLLGHSEARIANVDVQAGPATFVASCRGDFDLPLLGKFHPRCPPN